MTTNPRLVARYSTSDRVTGETKWHLLPLHRYEPTEDADKDLRCSHGDCFAHVEWRKGCSSYGGSVSRLPGYYSIDRKEHQRNCPWPSFEEKRKSPTFRQAFDNASLQIILNMDFPLGDPNHNRLADSRQKAERIRSEYNRFRRQNPHGTKAVHDVSELMKIFKKINEYDRSILDRVHVGHCQKIKPFERFNVMGGDKRLWDFFHYMQKNARNISKEEDAVFKDFPHLFLFHPERDTGQDYSRFENAERVVGSKVLYAEQGQSKITVVNVLELARPEWKQQIQRHTEHVVAAVPSLAFSDVRYALQEMNAGRSCHVPIYWTIVSDKQFAPSANAQRVYSASQQTDLDLRIAS